MVTFRSKSHNLRVLRFNETKIPDPLGGEGTTVPGLRYEFNEFFLYVDDALAARDLDIIKRREELRGRQYDKSVEEQKQDTLDYLRGRKDYGEQYVEIPLSDMAPPPDDALKLIAKMAATLDRDGLTDLIADERETFQREVVIETAEEALANVQPIIDAHEAQQAEQPPPETPAA